MKTASVLLALLALQPAFAQDWLWTRDDRLLNPSGIDLQTNVTQFQVLDWYGDGLWDFMINETGSLVYYEQMTDDPPFWIARDLNLPEIGFRDPNFYPDAGLPKNFRFIDWDDDGDFDLAADSSKFWWNVSSNANPIWQPDNDLLSGIEFGYNLFFADYEGDGDWDAVADFESFYGGSKFFVNDGSNVNPSWTRLDTLLVDVFSTTQLTHWNSDQVFDVTAIIPVPADPCNCAAIWIMENNNTPFSPEWQNVELNYFPLFWGTLKEPVFPTYDVVDYNRDGLPDVIKNDWDRHLTFFLNTGNEDSVGFQLSADVILGAVNVESKARPFFLDSDKNDESHLVISEDRFMDYFYHFVYQGKVTTFENHNGHFDPGFQLDVALPNPFKAGIPNLTTGYTFNFADTDSDGDKDILSSYFTISTNNHVTGSRVEYFQNTGSMEQPNWVADTTGFPSIDVPGALFYDPHLIDIDHDGQLDLFIQSAGKYKFLTRSTIPELHWSEIPEWLTGIASPEHHSAVFADLTRDGLPDLIFGETDGTLSFYKNIGSATAPVWYHIRDAFVGINVGSLAVPAFADLNGDTRLDLVVGNGDGRLFYFHNESTVDVATGPQPETFQLHQNYPNPFNPETTIEYELAQPGHVRLTIYNLLGQRVQTLVDSWQPAGPYRINWDGGGERGARSVSSGVYVYELKIGETVLRKKMVLLH